MNTLLLVRLTACVSENSALQIAPGGYLRSHEELPCSLERGLRWPFCDLAAAAVGVGGRACQTRAEQPTLVYQASPYGPATDSSKHYACVSREDLSGAVM